MLDTLGEMYMNLGLFDAAGSLLEQSLSIRQSSLSPKHPDIATSLSQLGYLRLLEDRYSEAESLQQAALAIRESTFGRAHADTAFSLYIS